MTLKWLKTLNNVRTPDIYLEQAIIHGHWWLCGGLFPLMGGLGVGIFVKCTYMVAVPDKVTNGFFISQ